MARLEGKVALLIGATGGIGAVTAEMFAAEGASVVFAGRRAAEGEALAEAITAKGGSALFVQADVADEAQVEQAVARTVEKHGRLDILLNNAGGSSGADGPVTTFSIDEYWKKMRIDVLGTFLGSRFAIPKMVKSGGGSVINMASMAGFGGSIGRDAYSSAKGAVLTLTQTMARTWVKDRIRVNAIAPAAVATDRILGMLESVPDAKSVISAQVLGLIDPRDIAYAAVFLGSDESTKLTGQTIGIHAGMF